MPGETAQPAPRRRQIEPKEVEKLLLDWKNPRLVLEKDPGQDAIIKKIFRAEAVEELALSLVRNGYFSEEPLVAAPIAEGDERLVVVEGNRRLATLKLLLDPALRSRVGVATFPDASQEALEHLKSVPVVVYDSREEIVPYLGFRHITGAKKWDPYSKARYVASLVEAGRPIEEIEESIGDAERAVKKLYQSYVLFRQIISDIDGDEHEIRDSFSTLEVVLGQQQIKNRLGIPRALPSGPLKELVPNDKLEQLADLVSWVFGNKQKGEGRIISDTRQISQRLGPVVGDADAYAYLKKTRDLEGAYERTGGDRQFFSRQIAVSVRAAERANGVLPIVRSEDGVSEEIERLVKIVEAMKQVAR